MSYIVTFVVLTWAVLALLHLGGLRGRIRLTGRLQGAARLAARTLPFVLLLYGVYGLALARSYSTGWYGVVLDSQYWPFRLVVPQAALFSVLGAWLLVRVYGLRVSGTRGVLPGQELLLGLALFVAAGLLGLHNWFGVIGWTAAASVAVDLVAALGAVLLMLVSRVWAATLAAASLLVLGVYGILIAELGPAIPGGRYGFVTLGDAGMETTLLAGSIQGTIMIGLGLWLVPRVIAEHTGAGTAELHARAERLTRRVETLTQTRADAVDTAAAELRRIERNLHDGAQARLVALGLSLQAAERLFPASPEAALELVGEAKQASSKALNELRDLVRGIYPPVLADRGLADAVRTLGLDCPLDVVTEVSLPVEVDMPVAAAVYFSIAEALTNAARHSGARTVWIQLSHEHGALRAQVTDDGAGGADPEQGTGLKGIERRLTTFDGILAVSSPPGGPTIVAIEVPCASSSGKTSSC